MLNCFLSFLIVYSAIFVKFGKLVHIIYNFVYAKVECYNFNTFLDNQIYILCNLFAVVAGNQIADDVPLSF